MHPRDPPKVLLQPLYPIRGVDHGLDVVVVIQVSEIRLVGSILTASPDTSVIPAPFGTEPLPLIPGLFHGIVPVSCAEDLSQVVSNIPLVTVADIAQYVALQVGGASLEAGAGKHLADDIIKSLETVRAYEPDSRDTSLVKVIEHLSPAKGAFRRLVIDAENLPGLVLLDGKEDIESFRINAALAVDLDMEAVDKHFPYLFLRQAFGVQRACKTFTLLLLIAQYGQYAGMEVPVSVTRYTEGQCPAMAVCPARTVAVALVPGYAFFLKIFPAFRHHEALLSPSGPVTRFLFPYACILARKLPCKPNAE